MSDPHRDRLPVWLVNGSHHLPIHAEMMIQSQLFVEKNDFRKRNISTFRMSDMNGKKIQIDSLEQKLWVTQGRPPHDDSKDHYYVRELLDLSSRPSRKVVEMLKSASAHAVASNLAQAISNADSYHQSLVKFLSLNRSAVELLPYAVRAKPNKDLTEIEKCFEFLAELPENIYPSSMSVDKLKEWIDRARRIYGILQSAVDQSEGKLARTVANVSNRDDFKQSRGWDVWETCIHDWKARERLLVLCQEAIDAGSSYACEADNALSSFLTDQDKWMHSERFMIYWILQDFQPPVLKSPVILNIFTYQDTCRMCSEMIIDALTRIEKKFCVNSLKIVISSVRCFTDRNEPKLEPRSLARLKSHDEGANDENVVAFAFPYLRGQHSASNDVEES